ncbi:Oxygen-evolving enhancer protein [Trema orientale]|uniref:Oxygen-evolving enhancer protein n=1 Tax=Trema orientale TaxID=63057 RepID=A0A2P5FX77_TREOI|nr:Oxygen-evolving enhancer protein [Trema orientale]
MAHAMASMAGLHGSSQAVLESSLQLSGSTRLNMISNTRVPTNRTGFTVKAQQGSAELEASSRRAMLGLVAAGFARTLNSDEPRDLQPPLKDRFFLQPLTPAQAAQRAKESTKDIPNVKDIL